MRKFIIAISLFFLCCCDNKTEIKNGFTRTVKLCNEAHIINSSIEFVKKVGINATTITTIELDFNTSNKLDSLYKINPKYLLGLLAYSVYEDAKQNFISEKFQSIIVKGKFNDTLKEKTYDIIEFDSIQNIITIADKFLLLASKSDTVGIRAITEKNYISDLALYSLLEGINHLAKNGKIKSDYISGINFDELTDTKENVTILQKYITKEKASEIYTFYILNTTKKIVFVDIKSSN